VLLRTIRRPIVVELGTAPTTHLPPEQTEVKALAETISE
jgi:hypothetical protein